MAGDSLNGGPREDPRCVGTGKRRGEFPATEGGARKVAATAQSGGAELKVSFTEEIRRWAGEVSVWTVDGIEHELPPEVTVASSGLQSLLATQDQQRPQRGRNSLLLRQPDCTLAMLQRVEATVRSGSLPDELSWPSEEACSFLRCVAFLGIPALLDMVAEPVGQLLANCILKREPDALRETFGQVRSGAVDEPSLAPLGGELQARIRESHALGSRAEEVVAAALAGAASSPLRATGLQLLLRVLSVADRLLSRSAELAALQDAATELDMLAALRSVADSRFQGSRCVIEAALAQVNNTLAGREMLDQGLATLESTLQACNAEAASCLAAWLQSPCGLGASQEARGRAAALLRLAAPRGHVAATQVFVAAATCDADDESPLREAAIDALGGIAAKGDPEALQTVAAWLRSSTSEASRLQGLQALKQITALEGLDAVLQAVAECLTDASAQVRQHAVSALASAAQPGSEEALAAARAGKPHTKPEVRLTAVAALTAVAEWWREEAGVSDLSEFLRDPSPEVRDAALDALAAHAARGLPTVCAELGRLLNHGNWGVRARALVALGRKAEIGDVEVAKAIAARLEDQALGVRTQVPTAFEHLLQGQRGHQVALGEVMGRLSHTKWTVRQAAAAALSRVAERGNQEAVLGLLGLLRDSMASVRSHALDALGELAPLGGQGLRPGLEAAYSDRDPSVRATALEAAARLLPRGCGWGLALALRGLRDTSSPARVQAATAVGRLASGDSVGEELGVLAALLEDLSEPVRCAAGEGLVDLARAGSPLQALAAVRPHCQCPSQGPRRAAEHTYKRLEALCTGTDRSLTASTCPVKAEEGKTDEVARGVGEFALGMSRDDQTAAEEKAVDPVTRGLQFFLAEQRKRVGPVCALEASPAPPPQVDRPPPTPASAASIFRPPPLQPKEEEAPGSSRARSSSSARSSRSRSRSPHQPYKSSGPPPSTSSCPVDEADGRQSPMAAASFEDASTRGGEEADGQEADGYQSPRAASLEDPSARGVEEADNCQAAAAANPEDDSRGAQEVPAGVSWVDLEPSDDEI